MQAFEPIISPTNLRPNDLLRIGGVRGMVANAYVPDWVYQEIDKTPVVVVRRCHWPDGLVPVGIRGKTRDERFAASFPIDCIQKIITPEQLVKRSLSISCQRARSAPALQAFVRVIRAWSGIALPWGPTGSVGFELATGRPTVTQTSDLDIIIHSVSHLTEERGFALLALLQGRSSATMDIQVEAPAGCFSLREFCEKRTDQLLVKTCAGPRLTSDPWRKSKEYFG